MIPRIFVAADYANVAEGGKLNVLGVFGVIYAKGVPYQHPQMWLVAHVEFDALEAGDKQVEITLEDADGKLLRSLSGVMNVPAAPESQPLIVNQMVRLNGVVFPDFGRYEFKIRIDDAPEMTIPLTVARMPAR